MEAFGRYELLRRFAVGGMAEIFLARSASLDGFEKDLVIKRIRPELSDDEQFFSMFIDEAKISITFNHPNIVQVFDFGKSEGSYYLAMEYVHGCDLDAILQLSAVENKGLPEGLALYIMGELLKGLDYAHNKQDRQGRPLGVVHRDISPANVLISFDGGVKVADFGIAKAAGAVTKQEPGQVVGKLSYMAPEQASGKPLDGRTDLFSCGIVLWEMLTGKHLRGGAMDTAFYDNLREPQFETPSVSREGLAPDLDQLVMRALAANPNDRFSSARDFGSAIHAHMVKHHAEANLYTFQAFIDEHRSEIRQLLGYDEDDDIAPSEDTIDLLTDQRQVSEKGTLILPQKPSRTEIDWSPGLIRQIEAFRQHPSLFRFIAMGDICQDEGQPEAALVFYRAAAGKFAQHGLLAQCLLCCKRQLQLQPYGQLRDEMMLYPSLVSRNNDELTPYLFKSEGPVEDLIAELLDDTNPSVGSTGEGTPLLSYLGGEAFAELAQASRLKNYEEGEHVVAQGESGRTMYLIADGRVIVHALNSEASKVYLSSLTAGDFFGENSFFTGAPRSATVEVLYSTEVFEIDSALYEKVMHDNQQASEILLRFYKERIVETVMAKSPTFGLLQSEDRRRLVEKFVIREFGPGETVIAEGQPGNEIFLIKSGTAEVFTEKGGPRTVLGEIGPGTIFGEVASIRQIARTASVTAKTKLETLELPGQAFFEVLQEKPDLKQKVMDVVAKRARENIDKVMGPSPFARPTFDPGR